MVRWYFFTYIVFVNYWIIGTNTWICISFFLQNYECIKLNFGLNSDMRKVWISCNIITVWYIQIILFATIVVLVNSNTYPLPRLLLNLPTLFTFLLCKHHNYLFYFYKIVPQ